MEVDRRSLMKGLLATGALLSLGIPSWTFAAPLPRRPKHGVLLLGDTGVDDLFANGTRAACAGMGYEGLETMKLQGGLLTGTGGMVKLLEQSRGVRCIALVDDASAVIFLELARTAGVRLLSMGTHAGSTENLCQLRHAWATTSPAHSTGGLLTSQFLQRQASFSITENFLQEPLENRALTSWSAPGFFSYRFTEREGIHMHCSGLSLPDGCGLLGLETTDGWISIPSEVCKCDSVTWQSENWVESVGYAVTAAAFGVASVQESCSSRAFLHRSRTGERIQPTERFVSFVMDL